MQTIPGLRSAAPYTFTLAGIVWLVLAYDVYTSLLVWPAVACVASGILLRLRREGKFTLALSRASALLGFLLSSYQVYSALLVVSGPFAQLAVESAAAFVLFAAVHLVLFYTAVPPKE